MTRSATVSLQRSEFDDFLFAPIGDEKNGMLLSVISALARLDLDPWLGPVATCVEISWRVFGLH